MTHRLLSRCTIVRPGHGLSSYETPRRRLLRSWIASDAMTHPLKTFLVEDSPMIRENLIAALEELAPIEVVGTAEDERSAVDWLAAVSQPCDLVIIDIFLKGGSGLGVLRAAQALGHSMKLVVLSNYATPDMRRKCVALGASRVFDKSSDIDALIAYCEKLATA